LSRCVAIFALRLATGLAFVGTGVASLAESGPIQNVFEAVGFGDWLRYAVAAIEIVGGTGLIVARGVAVAAYFLCFLSLCALLSHLTTGVGNPTGAVVLLTATGLITWTHRERLPSFLDQDPGAAQH
jgi:uncharacterized membrane protein YphA (DoxX/SURF4 family)